MDELDNSEKNYDTIKVVGEGDLSIPMYCYQKQFNSEINIEAVIDLLFCLNSLARLDVKKNKLGLVTDVELSIPKIDEDDIKFAMNNYINNINSPDFEARRNNLIEHLESKCQLGT